jgi:hypothetical protein
MNSMVNNIDMNSVKRMSKAFEGTSDGLDGIIEALRGHLPPPPSNPKTVVTYQNGDVVEYLIEGELGENSILNKEDAVKVEIGDGVTSIGNKAFYNCSSLSLVTIPDSVEEIGWWAFYSCSSLTSISIPNNVTSIGDLAFSGCSSLSSITIPDGVTSIESNVFQN